MRCIPYSIPEHRPLTPKERALLRHIVTQVAPSRVDEIDTLHITARGGCGKCPTVLFQPESTHDGNSLFADFRGGDDGTIGIMLWDYPGKLCELEAWSMDGTDVVSWPELATVRPLNSGQS